MEVFVASTSEHKINAVREALNGDHQIEGRKASSGVNEQPVGNEETIEGAINRLNQLKVLVQVTRYDLLVAIENGIFKVQINGESRWFDSAWVVVEDSDGNRAFAHSTGVQFDNKYVEEARNRGFETTTVGAILSEKENLESTDPHSGLTNNLVSRSDMITMAIRAAVGQLQRNA